MACRGSTRSGAENRVARLATRSIKTTAKKWALDLVISTMDLTTLEGQDTAGKVRAMCAKAMRPDPSDATAPAVAAVCVYPDLVGGREGSGQGQQREGRLGRDGVPERPCVAAGEAHRREGCGRGRRRRGRHGDRPWRVPRRRVPARVRRDRRGEAGVRRRAPQGHPRDRRARDLRQRPPRVVAGDDGRGRLHQDLDGEGQPRRRRRRSRS